MPCQNRSTHILQGIDASENDLPPKFACAEHVVQVLKWFTVDYSVHGAWVEPFNEGQIAPEDQCCFVTDEEIASILASKKRITEELERRIAKGEL